MTMAPDPHAPYVAPVWMWSLPETSVVPPSHIPPIPAGSNRQHSVTFSSWRGNLFAEILVCSGVFAAAALIAMLALWPR